jgi:DNA-directed RNA polymerase subunit RPC12/RpoP
MAEAREQTEPRCEGCGNHADEEDLFCANCGRETAPPAAAERDQVEEGFIGFDCETCGASMTFDAERQGLRCSFCGAVTLKRQPAATGRIRPRAYLPFAISRAAAEDAFRQWIGRGFFRPFGIAAAAELVTMTPVYIPCWRFHGRAHTYYAADSSATPAFARADWCPVFGEREGETASVLVPASGSLTRPEVQAISPFDFERGQPYRREDLHDHGVEDFGLSRRGARERARGLVPGRSRNVRVNPLFFDLRSEPILLPVWINAYRFQARTFRFLVNGQSGRITGNAPVSYARLGILLTVVAVVLAIILAVVAR